MNYLLKILFCLLIFSCSSEDNLPENNDPESGEFIYFPPVGSNTWETKSISDLNWNENEVQPLISFLEEKNTKGFIILHDGKIVLEEYFNGHTNTSPWYWASAGKTLTTAITGIAEDEGLLNIENKVSDYII